MTIGQYRERLGAARSSLVRARSLPVGAQQRDAVNTALGTLTATDHLRLPSGELIEIDDHALAGPLDTSSAAVDAAIARIDARIALTAHLGAPAIDPATADARLHDVVRQSGPAETGDIFELLGRIVLRFLSGLNAPAVDPSAILPAIGGLGIALILFIVATLGRALPERVRTEVLVRDRGTGERVDPAVHLRAADSAIASARPRDAMRELFLYAVTALADREAIRYDPALTDHELVLRAVAIPHADSFRALVDAYERAWFGMREPSVDESRRARELALRVAP